MSTGKPRAASGAPAAPAEPTYHMCPYCHGRGVVTRAMEAWQAFEELDTLARTHWPSDTAGRTAKRRARQRRAELMAIVMAYLCGTHESGELGPEVAPSSQSSSSSSSSS
jgi:hypothetical protein